MSKNYWIDDDGYLANETGDLYETVGGQIKAEHIEPLSRILESHDDLLEALLQLSRIASAINTAQHAGVEICPELWSDLYSLTNKAKQAIDKAGKGE